jgi:Tol biopolymer transport system component
VSSAPSVSEDGNFVAFVSLAPDLLPAGSPAIAGQQVYLHNRTTGQTSLISKNGTAGVLTGGNGVSSAPSISSDGNLIAFVSSAPDLLPAGSPVVSGQQIYFHNRVTGQTSLVSKNNGVPAVQGDGLSDTPSINADATNAIGGFVAFMSLSGNLASGGGQHVYARAIP